ncbi:PQQ-dependent sugar dehydrogenase [Oceanipulchritudo coccoides]|uniref:PQQ-dependent sugar dehydrogenase n=1 Tax=Oceanipulchritudo coccoides TaxID=2706888 RepID=UPI0030843EE8
MVSLFLLACNLPAQSRIGTGAVVDLYEQHCLACHGQSLEGGLGSNLVDDEWIHGDSDADMARVIREGVLDKGMVPYEGVLSDEEIQSLVIYIREMRQIALAETATQAREPVEGVFTSEHHSFTLEEVLKLEGDIFWSISFLPDGGMLLAKFGGELFVARDGQLGEPIKDLPEVDRYGQGGLLEAQAHPDYEENGWIYLGYSERSKAASGQNAYMTVIARGRIKDGQWIDHEDIFRAPDKFYGRSGVHFGTRFVFQDGYLYFSIGDRGVMQEAQDLGFPNGKIHRIHEDGRIPSDNPFLEEEGAIPSIWSYGNRNAQGLDLHPITGEIWSTEHGPRGGDELNRIERGVNYGWPAISYGINYNGKPITGRTAAPGMAQPVHYWTPSIAVCGIDFYEGDAFPKWKNDLFVGGLRSEQLERFKLDGDKVEEHEIVLQGQGRVRDVATGPDGALYLILNENRNGGPSRVVRLVPSNN